MPDYLWAFEKGLTIRDMADKHCGKDWVVSLDIKDYFPSIKQRHVLSTLENFGISGWAGKLISEIVTYKAKVPQGALTSPKISNMVTATTFGPQVHDLCELLGIVLTVYADDITMSFDYSEDLFDKVASEYQLWHPSHPVPEARSGKSICMMLIYLIYKILHSHGFKANRDKTKVMGPGIRHWVCGVVTNEKTNLMRSQRSFLRAVVHNITINGVECEARKTGNGPETFLLSIKGKISWFAQINPEAAHKLLNKLNAYLESNR